MQTQANDSQLAALLETLNGIGFEQALTALQRAFPQRSANAPARRPLPRVVRFPSPAEPEESEQTGTVAFPAAIASDPHAIPFDLRDRITLRAWYERCLLPEFKRDLHIRSIQSDRLALNRWEDVHTDIDIREVGSPHVEAFCKAMLRRGLSATTVNAYWRELRAMFNDAVRRGLLAHAPRISVRNGCKLLKEEHRRPRPCITESELARLWKGTNLATYPERSSVPAPKLWRTALVLLWTYGIRPSDLATLEWDDVVWSEGLLRFTAHKTSKLQGLPLTEIVIQHLQSVRAMQAGTPRKVFPSFSKRGFIPRTKSATYQDAKLLPVSGIYTTWRTEILPAADVHPTITFKNFRQTMVTRYNGIEPGLGAWIAGHYVPGVTAQHYDLPTLRIRKAIEAAPVPECFVQLD